MNEYIYIYRGKEMANYPQELAQDAVCESHTGHMTGLWFLPTRPLGLNTSEWLKRSQMSISGSCLHGRTTLPQQHRGCVHFTGACSVPTQTTRVKQCHLSLQSTCSVLYRLFVQSRLQHTSSRVNPLTPNNLYMSRTAPLTSKRCIWYMYSTNVGTEYFKHAL